MTETEKQTEKGTKKRWFGLVSNQELYRVLPMMIMMFLICFNYGILRNLKDSLVVTASHSSAAVIPFIKVWALLPMAILITVIFTRLSNRLSQEKVFYVITSGFLLFFLIFGCVLYPFREALHLHESADYLETILPSGCMGLVAMIRNWTLTLFYVMSELWSTIVMSVLFWGFANEVTNVRESRRFYGAISMASNVAAIVAGQFGIYISLRAFSDYLPFGTTAWDQSMYLLVFTVIVLGLLMMGVFRWMNTQVLTDPHYDEMHHRIKTRKKKKLSIRESFKYLANSKYLVCIAVMVIGYNLVINLVEVVWKDQLGKVYPNPGEYNAYMNYITTYIGIFSTVIAALMPWILRRFGWTKTALYTPVIMLITGVGFFLFYFFRENLAGVVYTLFGTTPLVIAVLFGAAQNVLSKSAKYSVFDGTKEMAFIPLSHEYKLKGKAAIDGVGSRFGKSGGSLIHQGLLILFSSLSASTPFVAVILTAVIVAWMIATKSLGKQFASLACEQEGVIPEPDKEFVTATEAS